MQFFANINIRDDLFSFDPLIQRKPICRTGIFCTAILILVTERFSKATWLPYIIHTTAPSREPHHRSLYPIPAPVSLCSIARKSNLDRHRIVLPDNFEIPCPLWITEVLQWITWEVISKALLTWQSVVNLKQILKFYRDRNFVLYKRSKTCHIRLYCLSWWFD
jgi:hypothetical protein